MDLIFLIHLIACWIWPFVFGYNLTKLIRKQSDEDHGANKDRRSSIFWAGLSLAMMSAIPYCFRYYLLFS